MATARERNSAVERAASAYVAPSAAAGSTEPGEPTSATLATTEQTQGFGRGVRPSLPYQCGDCSRWLDRGRMAVTPIGEPELCLLCLALGQVQGAVVSSQITLEDEDEVLEMLAEVYQRLWKPRRPPWAGRSGQ